MKTVLVLGAGFVAKPLVRYLLDHGHRVRVADLILEKAEEIVAGHANGEALAWNSDDQDRLAELAGAADLVVSLLPAGFHTAVAKHCVKLGKNMVTTSYVSPGMQALAEAARNAGVTVLNECGLDPGIDHMTATRVIHDVGSKGGRVVSFRSYCGGIPAPEANSNPFGYKFSWNPKGVLTAGTSDARYLKNDEEINVPGRELFAHHWTLKVPGYGDLEAYPNRDSNAYLKLYGLDHARTMFRGTLRHPGWCEKLKAIVDLGYLDTQVQDWHGKTYADLGWKLLGTPANGDLRAAFAARLEIGEDSPTLDGFDWLGLFSDSPLPIQRGAVIDLLTATMADMMNYLDDERDMVVLYHDFTAEYDGGKQERITSTIIAYGVPGQDSAMSRTVGLPAAVAARSILEGRFAQPGVLIPTVPALYNPVLDELETLDIKCLEATQPL